MTLEMAGTLSLRGSKLFLRVLEDGNLVGKMKGHVGGLLVQILSLQNFSHFQP